MSGPGEILKLLNIRSTFVQNPNNASDEKQHDAPSGGFHNRDLMQSFVEIGNEYGVVNDDGQTCGGGVGPQVLWSWSCVMVFEREVFVDVF